MATDFLVLGGIVFDEWSTPERMPFGGHRRWRSTNCLAARAWLTRSARSRRTSSLPA